MKIYKRIKYTYRSSVADDFKVLIKAYSDWTASAICSLLSAAPLWLIPVGPYKI